MGRERRRLNQLLLLLLVVGAGTLVGWPMPAWADVEEVVAEKRLDYWLPNAPTAAAGTAVAWYQPGRGVPPAVERGHTAATSWRIDWRLAGSPRADGRCAATDVRTRLAVSIALPSTAASNQPQLERLRLHEAGHLRIAQMAARRLDAELSALPPMSDCGSLHEAAARRAAAHIERLQQDQAAYDVSTEHGRRQPDREEALFR